MRGGVHFLAATVHSLAVQAAALLSSTSIFDAGYRVNAAQSESYVLAFSGEIALRALISHQSISSCACRKRKPSSPSRFGVLYTPSAEHAEHAKLSETGI